MLADTLYPVNLSVEGRRVVVVGAGPVAASKARELLVCGASVVVVAPDASAEMEALLADPPGGTADLLTKRYEPPDLHGAWLVVTATNDPVVNATVAEDAEAAGIWVNSADDPQNCGFALPSRLRREQLLVTVSTSGRSPALAVWLRRLLEDEIGPEYATLLGILAEERAAIRAEGRTTEGLNWLGALDSGMLELIRQDRLAEAKERLQACLSSSSE